MLKKIVKAVENFIFEPEEEINDAQIETLFYLATQVYINLCGHSLSEAQELATRQVQKWLNEGRALIALKRLWKTKFN